MALLGLLTHDYAARGERQSTRRAGFSGSERRRLLDYLQQHMAESLSLERLAAELEMSASQISRRFKLSFSMTSHTYVVQLRIDAACKKLTANKQRSPAELACSLGF